MCTTLNTEKRNRSIETNGVKLHTNFKINKSKREIDTVYKHLKLLFV